MNLRLATPEDAPSLAAVHAQAFDRPWDESDFEGVLEADGVFGFVVEADDPAGLLICRRVLDEAEILTVGVAPWARRHGAGRALMAAAIGVASAVGAEVLHLEVDVDNAAAVSLYESLGFVRSGLRKAYYDRGAGARGDALVMRLDLTPPPH